MCYGPSGSLALLCPKSQKSYFACPQTLGPQWGEWTPKSCPNFLFWTFSTPTWPLLTQDSPPYQCRVPSHALHRVYMWVPNGCHRGPRGQKIDFSTLVWNCSRMVRMAEKRPKTAQKSFFFTPGMPWRVPQGATCASVEGIPAVIWP